MLTATTPEALADALQPSRTAGRPVGLVPTMGALHDGHRALLAHARRQVDCLVGSVFVNPLQFDDAGDLDKYPRTPVADEAVMRAAGCDVLFVPTPAVMYPAPPLLTLDFGPLTAHMEGAARRGHFSGVGVVVGKLLQMVRPHRAFFGQKDLQQVRVVQQLVADLSMPVEVVACPTVREADGLALSSRNRR
ncbi:MAG: pantoate--beta-alanine ligase, partial [Catalinimonas sp.]